MLKSSKGLKRATVISIPSPIDTRKLAEAVEKLAFRECGKHDEVSWGFVRPDHTDTWPVLAQCGTLSVMTLRFDRRVLNKSRLSREWNSAVREKEKAEERKLTKDERDAIREDVKKKLYPLTAPSEHIHQAIYDSERRLLTITESSTNAVELFVEKLNRALEPQGIAIEWSGKNLDSVLESTLTAWVWRPTDTPREHGFEVGTDMRLANQTCKAVLSNQEAESEEVRAHLNHAKVVQSVDLIWNETVNFCLSAKRILSKMDFKSYCEEKIKEVQNDGKQEELRTYQQATLMVYYSAFLDLWDAVQKIPTEL